MALPIAEISRERRGGAQEKLLLGPDGAPSYVRMDIMLSNITRKRWTEIVFSLSSSVEEVKEKILRHTGLSAAADIRVYLRFTPHTQGILLANDKKTLRDYGCLDGCMLFVEYETEAAGEAFCAAVASEIGTTESLPLSGKYVMSDEVYEHREGTMRKFLHRVREQQNEKQQDVECKEEGRTEKNTGMKQTNQKEEEKEEAAAPSFAEQLAQAKEAFPIGRRCRLVGDRRGNVAYVGPRPSKSPRDIWIGVALDEPLGSTDGSDIVSASTRLNASSCSASKGNSAQQQKQKAAQRKQKLFDCSGDKYGEFVLMEEVELGDFPPLDPFDLTDEI